MLCSVFKRKQCKLMSIAPQRNVYDTTAYTLRDINYCSSTGTIYELVHVDRPIVAVWI